MSEVPVDSPAVWLPICPMLRVVGEDLIIIVTPQGPRYLRNATMCVTAKEGLRGPNYKKDLIRVHVVSLSMSNT